MRTSLLVMLGWAAVAWTNDSSGHTLLNNAGAVHRANGDLVAAEHAYQIALVEAEQRFGPAHPEIAKIVGNLAELYSHQNALLKSEALYRRAVSIEQQANGSRHPGLAVLMAGQASVYLKLGAMGKALSLLRRAAAILPPGDPYLATVYHNMAAVHAWEDDLGLAERFLMRALALRENLAVPDEAAIARERVDLARVRERMLTLRRAGLAFRP